MSKGSSGGQPAAFNGAGGASTPTPAPFTYQNGQWTQNGQPATPSPAGANGQPSTPNPLQIMQAMNQQHTAQPQQPGNPQPAGAGGYQNGPPSGLGAGASSQALPWGNIASLLAAAGNKFGQQGQPGQVPGGAVLGQAGGAPSGSPFGAIPGMQAAGGTAFPGQTASPSAGLPQAAGANPMWNLGGIGA